MEKKDLRTQMKGALIRLTPEEKKVKDKIIYSRVTSLPEFRDAKNVFTYVSMDMEADTKAIIRRALKSGKRVFVPRVDAGKKIINACPIDSLKELKKGTYNIPEPCSRPSGSKNFDIILVPGLVFDRQRNRLGKGGGYYDKFLKKTKGLRIGLCYREQICPMIPVNRHDIKMDIIISD